MTFTHYAINGKEEFILTVLYSEINNCLLSLQNTVALLPIRWSQYSQLKQNTVQKTTQEPLGET